MITNGIGIGVIALCILRIATGRRREVPFALYMVAAVFTSGGQALSVGSEVRGGDPLTAVRDPSGLSDDRPAGP